jgi:8-oxo-dGTP pyrophosphatase MutT (NUDIX family)
VPKSFYFDNTTFAPEQQLFEDLAAEMISIHGENFYYLRRKSGTPDDLYHEDVGAYYDEAVLIAMWVKDWGGFGGAGDFMSPVGGYNIGDTFTLVVARREWLEEVGYREDPDGARPLEGDLVFFPQNGKLYKVTFVEHESVFYEGGRLYVWELRCELFAYSGEVIDTGIPDIDGIDDDVGLLVDGSLLLESNGAILEDATSIPLALEDDLEAAFGAQNDLFQDEGDAIIDWSCVDPFVRYPSGKF